MKQFILNPESAQLFAIDTTEEFANYISGTASNLTGGVMSIYATTDELTIVGCNLKCEVINNCLYIDRELMIDFTSEIVEDSMKLYDE